jgi:serine/threonine protein kinase
MIITKELNKDGYTRAIDWWSVGVVLYEMLFGHPPFVAHTPPDLFTKILTHDPFSNLPTNVLISSSARSLLRELLQKDPNQRLATFQLARAHPFFVDVDWTALSRRELVPPFIPTTNGGSDNGDGGDGDVCKYFEYEFTKQSIELTPPPVVRSTAQLRTPRAMNSNLFDSFSYYGSLSATSSTSLSSSSGQANFWPSDRHGFKLFNNFMIFINKCSWKIIIKIFIFLN